MTFDGAMMSVMENDKGVGFLKFQGTEAHFHDHSSLWLL
jgi:hypothetical protein